MQIELKNVMKYPEVQKVIVDKVLSAIELIDEKEVANLMAVRLSDTLGEVIADIHVESFHDEAFDLVRAILRNTRDGVLNERNKNSS